MTLFEIGAEIRALHDLLSETDGDITESEQAIDAWLRENEVNLKQKLDSCGGLIMEFDARAKARKEEAARLSALSQADENNVERLGKRLKLFLEGIGETKVETLRFKFAVQKNGGKAALTVPFDWETEPARAPEAFQRRVIQLDREQIRIALEAGDVIEGCCIEERGTHLRIK